METPNDVAASGNPEDPVSSPPVATEGTAVATTPATAEATASAQGAADGTPKEPESFTKLDPNSLDPKLMPFYKSMLGDYTRKTQEAAQTLKAAEAARQKAEFYDTLMADNRVVEYLQKLTNPEPEAPQEDPFSVSEDEYAQAISSPQGMSQLMKKLFERASQPIHEKLAKQDVELETARAAEILDEFTEDGHPDLYELEQDKLISIQAAVDKPKSQAEYKQKLAKWYENAKRVTQKHYQRGYEAAKKELLAKSAQIAASATLPPQNSPGKTYSGPDPKTLTAKQAYELAKRGITVPQD